MKREVLLSPACRAPQLWGYTGEKKHTRIVVELPEDIAACNFYRAEITIKGKLFRTNYLEILDGKVCFELTSAMVETSGIITAQIIGYVVDENGDIDEIGKTEIYKGNIKKSLSGKLTPADSDPSLLDRILAKLNALLEKAHTHSNKATLDKLNCEGVQSSIVQSIYPNDLKFNGRQLRYTDAGKVLEDAYPIEKDGQKYLRLRFYDGAEDSFTILPVSEQSVSDFTLDETTLTDRYFVDIPIESSQDVTETEGDLTLNGTELDFGIVGGGGSGLTDTLKNALQTYFTNMQTLLTQIAYTTDSHIGNTLVENARAIVIALDSEPDEPDVPIDPDTDIAQSGNILRIVKGVTATQTSTTLEIA